MAKRGNSSSTTRSARNSSDSDIKKDRDSLEYFKNCKNFLELKEISDKEDNIFLILKEVFHENTLSRMLRYYFDPFENHGFSERFLRTWLRAVASESNCAFLLGRAAYQITSSFDMSLETENGRYRRIDLLLRIEGYRSDEHTAIVGIETKISAPESTSQIEDYQSSLLKRFPNFEHIMIFYLTPAGKISQSANISSKCTLHNISYNSIIRTGKRLLKSMNMEGSRSGLLLKDFVTYLERHVVKDVSEKKIKELVDALEKDPRARRALDVLRKQPHEQNIRSAIYERILPKIREKTNQNIEVDWHYPRNSTRPHEYNFSHKEIDDKLKRDFILRYMIHFKELEPTMDSRYSVMLMAWRQDGYEKSSANEALLGSLEKNMPPSDGKMQWGRWRCVWGSRERRFEGFTDKSLEGVAKSYVDTVNITRPIVLRVLCENSQRKKIHGKAVD